jgi:hypothetical protein
MESSGTEYRRLTEKFLATFDWKRSGITRDGFRTWARTRRQPPIRIAPQKWPLLRDGKPVPEEMVIAFSEYVSDELHLGRYPVSKIASSCDPEAPTARVSTRNAWRLGWPELLAFIARYPVMPEEAYCRDEQDIVLCARMVYETMGASVDSAASGDAAVAIAERASNIPMALFQQLMLISWQSDEQTVLFATDKTKSSLTRIGVSTLVPLTKSFYLRYRAGQADITDLATTDIESPSKYLLVISAAENRSLDHRTAKASRSMSQVLTIIYQVASLCPPLHRGEYDLEILSFAGSPENRQRLEAYRFKDVGTVTPRAGWSVMELVPPDWKKDPAGVAQYAAMKATIQVYQAAIAAMQKDADA